MLPPAHQARAASGPHIYVKSARANLGPMIRGWPWARVLFGAAVAGALALVAAALAGHEVPWWALAADAGALVVAIGAGVFLLGSGLFARPILGGGRGARARSRRASPSTTGPTPAHTRAAARSPRARRASRDLLRHRAARRSGARAARRDRAARARARQSLVRARAHHAVPASGAAGGRSRRARKS